MDFAKRCLGIDHGVVGSTSGVGCRVEMVGRQKV